MSSLLVVDLVQWYFDCYHVHQINGCYSSRRLPDLHHNPLHYWVPSKVETITNLKSLVWRGWESNPRPADPLGRHLNHTGQWNNNWHNECWSSAYPSTSKDGQGITEPGYFIQLESWEFPCSGDICRNMATIKTVSECPLPQKRQL